MRWMPWVLVVGMACQPSDEPGSTPEEALDDTLDTTGDSGGDVEPVALRIATFNVSLYGRDPNDMANQLDRPTFERASVAAAILQTVRPDVVLLNEVDRDEDGLVVDRLVRNFLEVSQGEGLDPLDYPYRYVPEVNTGEPSGADLDNDGQVVTTPGSEAYAEDALGYGEYPGQYGLVVLSTYPIDVEAVRTFRTVLWTDLPGNQVPADYYSDEALAVLPLSSKTHADVPLQVGDHTVHFWVSHPTPPSFDGPADENGRRNHDEIAFWSAYMDAAPWLVDDQGRAGGFTGEHFVIAGDQNADPEDGDSGGEAISALLGDVRTLDAAPTSLGGAEQAALQGGANDTHRGDPALDTSDFEDREVGNLRIDHVIPSSTMALTDAGVFWPASTDPQFAWVGTFPFPGSDHRLVWVDVVVGE